MLGFRLKTEVLKRCTEIGFHYRFIYAASVIFCLFAIVHCSFVYDQNKNELSDMIGDVKIWISKVETEVVKGVHCNWVVKYSRFT